MNTSRPLSSVDEPRSGALIVEQVSSDVRLRALDELLPRRALAPRARKQTSGRVT